jgi:hypothetical protein
MKTITKLALTALTTALILAIIPQETFAQSRAKKKALDREWKRKKSFYDKEGWTISGSSRTLEVALIKHIEKIDNDENFVEFVGASRCKATGTNVCRQTAASNARRDYSSRASAHVRGVIASHLHSNAEIPKEEMDLMIGKYEELVQSYIGGALTESYAVVKSNKDKDNTQQMEMVFILDLAKAEEARTKAMQQSLEETNERIKLSSQTMKTISDAVRERFDLN